GNQLLYDCPDAGRIPAISPKRRYSYTSSSFSLLRHYCGSMETPLLLLSDDLLESIIRFLLEDARADRKKSRCFATSLVISHICTRFRTVMLGAQAFWRDVECNEFTQIDALKLNLDRAGSLCLNLRFGTNLTMYSTTFARVYREIYRAEYLGMFGPYTFTKVDPPHNTRPLTYELRPLRELVLELVPATPFLPFIGVRLTTISLSRETRMSVRGLECALRESTALQNLHLQECEFLEIDTVDCDTHPQHPQGKGQALQKLTLFYVAPTIDIAAVVLRLFPETVTQAPYICIHARISRRHWDFFMSELQLLKFGPPSCMRITGSESQYQLQFSSGIVRELSISGFDYCDTPEYRLLLKLLNSTKSLELCDGENSSCIFWLEKWYGNTWSALSHLEIAILHPDPDLIWIDDWVPDASKRISLPNLKTLVLRADKYSVTGALESWGKECAFIIDKFAIEGDVEVEFRLERPPQLIQDQLKQILDLKQAVNHAYQSHYGVPYFPLSH
ncbi:hypothetical protein BKA62DRAFT_785581, partial [Auriculariales sp. MPI-PUGE-AT-0066]